MSACYFNDMRIRSASVAVACSLACSLASLASAKPPAKATGKSAAGRTPATPPKPAASFEELFEEAEPVRDLATLIDPLFDNCDPADPLGYRQCQGARSFLESEARSKTYVAIGDPAALEVSPFDAVTKQIDLDIHGCLACLHPIKLTDAKGAEVPRFVTTKPPRAIKGGRALGVEVGSQQLTMSTPAAEAKWRKQEKRTVPRLRVQFVFKLGPVWSSGNFSGVAFTPLAHRVFDACSGEVLSTAPVVADGKPGKVATPVVMQPGDPLRCPPPGLDLTPEEKAAKDEFARLPVALSRSEIEKGMAAVQERVHDCHVEFEETGTVNLRVVIEGLTGKMKEAHILPPFDKTPAGLCVRAAIRDASFSHFKTETQEVKIPVYLR